MAKHRAPLPLPNLPDGPIKMTLHTHLDTEDLKRGATPLAPEDVGSITIPADGVFTVEWTENVELDD